MGPQKIVYCSGIVILGICIGALYSLRETVAQSGAIPVVCTTTMLADAVHAIAQDKVVITTLMGPGVDPHLYRAREGDIHRIAHADLLFFHGLHLEGKMGELFDGMQQYVVTVNVSNALSKSALRQAEVEGIYDPHIWHDVPLWISCVQYMVDALVAYDPDNEAYYRNNASRYIATLHELDGWARAYIDTIPHEERILVTAHDAFSYFGRAYSFHIVSLQGISTESDIGTRDILDLVQFIGKHAIPVMFVENSIPTRSVQAVQEAVYGTYGVTIALGNTLYSDSLGNKDSDAATYVGMMRYNITHIVEGLKQKHH